MTSHAALFSNPEFVADLQGDQFASDLAVKWGTGSTFIKKHRAKIRSGKSLVLQATEQADIRNITEESSDGKKSTEFVRDRPVTLEDARAWIRNSGDDPDDYVLSVRSIAYGAGQSSNRMAAYPKPGTQKRAKIDTADLQAALENYQPVPRKVTPGSRTFVICPADLQSGKTDYGLTSADLAKRVMASFAAAAEIAANNNFAEIVIADLGDAVENINSTSSQRATNDLAITEQVRLSRRLFLEGIKLLAPHAPLVTFAAVPSNHGSVRIGPKSPENHVLDDYGIEIAEQLRDVCAESEKLQHVRVIIPEQSQESLAFETSGTVLGMAHGHQANNADGLGRWWQGQSHGRQAFADARIALFGHFHSLRVQQSGDARWLFVSPSSDNGSSWFTNRTGERSQAGMLSFITADNQWSDLRIL